MSEEKPLDHTETQEEPPPEFVLPDTNPHEPTHDVIAHTAKISEQSTTPAEITSQTAEEPTLFKKIGQTIGKKILGRIFGRSKDPETQRVTMKSLESGVYNDEFFKFGESFLNSVDLVNRPDLAETVSRVSGWSRELFMQIAEDAPNYTT